MNNIAELAKKRKSTVVTLILPKESLSYKHLLDIQKCMTNKECVSMELLIHCSGGDINTAYQIIELLRMHCKRLTAIVPYFATSAATLLCLGSDKIVIDELAHLGPLDTQILETVEGGNKDYISALDPFKALEELRNFSLEILEHAVLLIIRRSGLSVNESVKHAVNYVQVIMGPLLAQLNVEKLGRYNRALSVGKQYANRLLEKYLRWETKKCSKVVEKLVYGYPSHNYIINYNELRTLGFDVALLKPDEKDIVKNILKLPFQQGESLIQIESEPQSPPSPTDVSPDNSK